MKTTIAQIEPSYDDLAFKPKMTWITDEEWKKLVEFARDYGFVEYCENILVNDVLFGLEFSKDGEIRDVANKLLAEHRIYEQMKAIIENMFDKCR